MSAASNAFRRSGRVKRDAQDVAVPLGAEVLGHGEELRVTAMLKGAVAAAVTPLRDGRLDSDAVGPYVDFLAGHGVDGLLALGTTGEGVMFAPEHRREIAPAFVEAAAGRIQVAVHAGAQTTARHRRARRARRRQPEPTRSR